jgi:hypothetical protein
MVLACSIEKEDHPVVMQDPIADITVVEDHSEVLVEWMKKGYKDMVLVNVDHHDDLRYIPAHKIYRLRKLYEEEKWDEIHAERDMPGGLYAVSDFIYPAYKLGIIKKVYWVSTSDLLDIGELEKGGEALMRLFNFPSSVISSFQVKDGVYTGNMYGVDVTITTMKGLPAIREPVLLSIDLDYFSNMIDQTGFYEIDVLRDFFKYLKSKEMPVIDISLSYSVNGDYTPITDRYLGEEIVQIFRDPSLIFKAEALPVEWIVRDYGFSLLRKEHPAKAYDFFYRAVRGRTIKDYPVLKLGKAASLSLLDMDEEAFEILQNLLHDYPQYDSVYLYLAKANGRDGKIKWAERYFREYLERHPDYGARVYPIHE